MNKVGTLVSNFITDAQQKAQLTSMSRISGVADLGKWCKADNLRGQNVNKPKCENASVFGRRNSKGKTSDLSERERLGTGQRRNPIIVVVVGDVAATRPVHHPFV